MSKGKDVATLRTNARPCSFCKECDDVEVLFGLFYNIGKINVHHFCLLLSTTLLQKGRDDEGVLGFLHEDIICELRRAHKRKCCYCGQWCPTLRCDQPGCGRLFHLPCGRRNGSLNLFHDRFQSYCAQHRPIQRVPAGIITGRGRGASGSAVIQLERLRMSRDGTRLVRPRDVPDIGNLHIGPQSRALIENAELKNEVSVVTLESGKAAAAAAEWHTCGICYDRVTPLPTAHTLWPPCCKGDKWFHRICVAKLALSAGRHYVKCPLCNNQPIFLDALYKYGFYVPDQDASWEREAGAFRELHERPKECYVPCCLHQAGRDKAGSKRWQLVICSLCGSQAAHRACADISVNRTLICSRCRPDVPRDEYSESHNDCESISVVSNLEKMTSVKSRCNSVTSVCDSGATSGRRDDYSKSDNNYLGNENLHLMNNDDGLSKNDSITSWRDSILASMSQASTSKQDGYNHLTENLIGDDFVINKSDDYFTPSLENGIDNMSRAYSIENEILHVNDVVSNSDKAFNVKSQTKTEVITQKKKKPLPRRSFRMSLLTYNKRDLGPQTNEDRYLVKNNYILRKRSASVFLPAEPSAKPSKRSRGAAVTYSIDDLNIAALQCLAGEKITFNENSTPVSNELPIVEECVVSAREVSDSTLANSKPKAVNLLRGSGSQRILRVKISPKSRSHAVQAKSTETVDISRVKETFKGKLGKYFEHLEELKKKRKIMDEKKDSSERAECSLPVLTVKPCPKSKKSFYIENGDTVSLEDKMDEEEQATVKYKIINNDFAKVITSRRVYTIAIPNSHRVKNKKRKSAEIGQTDITSYFRTLDTKVEAGRGDAKSAGVTVDENVGDSSGVALVADKSSDVAAEKTCSGANVNGGSLKKVKKRKSRKKSNKKGKSNINKLKIKDKSHVSSARVSDLVNGECDVLIGDVLSDCDVTKNDESKGISVNETEINEVIDANNCGGCNNEIIDSTLSDCVLLDNDNDAEDDPTVKTSEDGDMTTHTNDTKSITCVDLDETDEITSDEIIDGSKSGDGHLKENIIDSDCEIISYHEEAADLDSIRAASAVKPVEVEKEKSAFGVCIIDSLVNVATVIKTDNEEMAADNGLRSNKSEPPLNEVSLYYRRNTKRVIKYNYSSSVKVDTDDVKDCDVVIVDNDGIQSGKDISIKKEDFKNSIATHYIDLVDRKRQNDNCTIVDDHKPSASTHKYHTASRDTDRKHKINSEPFNCIHKAAEHVGVQNFNFMITECDVSHAKRRKQQRPEDDVKPEFVKTRTITDFFSPVAAIGVSTGESSFNRQKFNKDFWMSGSDYLKTIRSDIKNRHRRMDISNRYKRSKNRYN